MKTNYRAPGFADRYRRARVIGPEASRQWSELLARAVPADEVETVLDAGAGVGRFWSVLTEAWHPRRIIGMDASDEMLARSEPADRVARVVGTFGASPIASGSVDVVFCSMALHHAVDPAVALKEFSRVIRSGGHLVLRTGTKDTVGSFEFLRHFPDAERVELDAMPSAAGLEAQARLAGLLVVTSETVHAPTILTPWRAWVSVLRRGFPSLQIISRRAFVVGAVRYGLWLLVTAVLRRPRPHETSLMMVARRP